MSSNATRPSGLDGEILAAAGCLKHEETVREQISPAIYEGSATPVVLVWQYRSLGQSW